jgi:hypothetical protein
MDATTRVLQHPHPLSRHPKRGDQHSSHPHLPAPGPDERRGSSPLSGATLAEGSARFCARAPARQGTERVAGVAMREGARRDGDKLVIDPDICLNDLGIHMQLGHPDMLRLDAYADSPPSLVDKTDRKPFGGQFFQVMGQMPPEAKDRFE